MKTVPLPPAPENTFTRYKNSLIHELIINSLPKNKVLKVLDIGFGNGIIACFIAQTIKGKLIAVDINSNEVKKAKKRYKLSNLDFKTADIFKLPFKGKEFDVITSLGPGPIAFPQGIEAVNRFIKKNGLIFMDYSNHFSIYNWPNIIKRPEKHWKQFKTALMLSSQETDKLAVRYNFGNIGINKHLKQFKNFKVIQTYYLYCLPPQFSNKKFVAFDNWLARWLGILLARNILFILKKK